MTERFSPNADFFVTFPNGPKTPLTAAWSYSSRGHITIRVESLVFHRTCFFDLA